MLKVVSAHLIESILRSQDVVHKVQHNEAVIYDLNYVGFPLLLVAQRRILFGKLEGFEIDDHFFQVETVDRNDVCLQVVLLTTLHPDFNALLCIVFVWGRLYIHFGYNELLDF